MKRKFYLNSEVKRECEWNLEHYKEFDRILSETKEDMIPSPIASYSLTGGVSGTKENRTTENNAVRMVSNQYIHMTEWWRDGISKAIAHLDASDKQLIDLVYWKQTHTPEGAGLVIGMSRSTAYEHINNILLAIAMECGKVSL